MVESNPELKRYPPAPRKTKAMKVIEERFHKEIKELLREKYVDTKKSPKEIAENLDSSRTTIYSWLHRMKIPLRTKSESERITWNDPDKKPNLIANVHKPESDRKRSQSIKANWDQHPERKQQAVKDMAEGKRKKRAQTPTFQTKT